MAAINQGVFYFQFQRGVEPQKLCSVLEIDWFKSCLLVVLSLQYGNSLDLENLEIGRAVNFVFKRTYLKKIGVLFFAITQCKIEAATLEIDDFLFWSTVLALMQLFLLSQVRQELKKFSKWPTYPQIYVNGEFVGGVDIIKVLRRDSSALFFVFLYFSLPSFSNLFSL